MVELPDGGRLAYDVAGQGPDVVLLHPGLWDRRTWDPQMRSFPEAGFRTIRYDLRGYGGSSRPTGAPYSHVEDLLVLLDHLGVDEAALVGCSMGGRVVIDVALERPDRAWALVLAAPGLGGFEATKEEDDWYEDVSAPIGEAVEAGDLQRARLLELELLWAPLGTDDAVGRRIREIALDNLHELTMDESAEVIPDPPAAHRLHEVDVPTLVLKAAHDPPYSRRVSELVATGIPGAREVLIEDADHVVNLRSPEAFDAAAIAFLREVAP